MIENCGRCHWFKAEPETHIGARSPVQQIEEAHKSFVQKTIQNGGSNSPTYGQCTAVFVDVKEIEQVHHFGTFSNSACRAKDDLGNKLFQNI